jgi:hypothetical protein
MDIDDVADLNRWRSAGDGRRTETLAIFVMKRPACADRPGAFGVDAAGQLTGLFVRW